MRWAKSVVAIFAAVVFLFFFVGPVFERLTEYEVFLRLGGMPSDFSAWARVWGKYGFFDMYVTVEGKDRRGYGEFVYRGKRLVVVFDREIGYERTCEVGGGGLDCFSSRATLAILIDKLRSVPLGSYKKLNETAGKVCYVAGGAWREEFCLDKRWGYVSSSSRPNSSFVVYRFEPVFNRSAWFNAVYESLKVEVVEGVRLEALRIGGDFVTVVAAARHDAEVELRIAASGDVTTCTRALKAGEVAALTCPLPGSPATLTAVVDGVSANITLP